MLGEGISSTKFIGYHLISSPPATEDVVTTISIDTTRLLIQVSAIGVLVGGVYMLTGRED
jgi:hypothetical protein